MTDKKPIGLYIHIPFCSSKCPYCDFYSLRADDDIRKRYIGALTDRIKETDMIFDTVYLGGGTPSSIGSHALSGILSCVKHTDNAEITVECNPYDTGRPESLFSFEELREAGVNRISLGLQSAVDSERRSLGRRSGKEDVTRAIERAVKAGIDNVSLDLMIGIPGQTSETLDESLEYCINSGAKHISSYMLQIEEGTVFEKKLDSLDLPDDDTVAEMYLRMTGCLEKNGFLQYEISNFAIPGYESRHNLKYWRSEEYLGIGPAAHSFADGRRYFFRPDIEEFMKCGEPVPDGEGGSKEEYVMLALRLKEGLNYDRFRERFGCNVSDDFAGYCRYLADNGYAELHNNSVNLTPDGFLLSNTIICELTEKI